VVALEELLLYAIAISATVIAAVVILYATRRRKATEEEPAEATPELESVERWRHRSQRSVTPDDAKGAQDELRTLGLEREILSDSIRRLYEAHAEGKITEEEREMLAKRYKSRMMKVKDAITEKESVVALHELEAMQQDLIKLFDERFDDLSGKIETLRTRIGLEATPTITPIPIPLAIPTQMEAEEPGEKQPEKRTRRKPSRKPSSKPARTAAEAKIERIKAEVEKVLDRLEQMEVET
jgi:hypothetical protein